MTPIRRASAVVAVLLACAPATAGIQVQRDAQGRVRVGNLPSGTYARLPAATGATDDAGPAEAAPAPPGSLNVLIREAAARHRLSPQLVRAVVAVESAFDPRAASSKGARGLMQLMPATAQELGVTDVYDPRRNLDGGSRYLRSLLDRFDGDLTLALAAYNAGPDAVRRYDGVPPYRETRDYIRKVLARLRDAPPEAADRRRIYRYRDASGNLMISNIAPGTMGTQVGSTVGPTPGDGTAR